MTPSAAASRPEEFSSFVGRAAEVGELRGLLHVMRAVTLCGAGGIGKSRLALRLLDAVAGDFADGAWFIELSDLHQPEHVVRAVAAAVGVGEEPGRPLIDTLADSMRHRRVLLVLDNCEHLIHECASLCQRLLASAPALQVVATSREPLRVAAETVWQVPPLGLPPNGPESLDVLRGYDAVRLFSERATAVAPGFVLGPGNIASVASICRALDGLPLAIELAAAWVRVLSVEQIAARLDRRLALLTSTDRTVPARQQTLRATFDWSYDLLSESQQVLLRRLSALAGWSLEMAEQVCADDGLADDGLAAADILDLLAALADKSLVEVEPEVLGQARYRMLETVREYASGWLDAAGETTMMRLRMRAYTDRECEQLAAIGMARVPAPWSARVAVFRRVDLEAPNLREVLSACLADGDAETGLRICTSIRPVWIVRGTFAAGAAWLDAFLKLPGAPSVPASVRGPALAGRAQLALALGAQDAEELATAGLELCWAAGDPFWVAAALNLLTEIAVHAGRPDEAAARGAEALQVARSSGDRWNEGYALGTMSAAAAIRGNLREAQRLAEEALAIMRAIEQQWGSARALLGLGDLARLRAEDDTARDYYLEALTILREVNARPEIARCLAGLGSIAMSQSDLPGARQHLTESLRLSFTAGSRIGIARGLEAIARLVVQEQDPALAVQLAGAVSALRADAHLPPVPGARTQRFLDAAAGLGEHAVTRLWQDGTAMTPAAAVRLALEPRSGTGPAARPEVSASELTTGALTNGAPTNGAGTNGAGTNGAGTNGAVTTGAATTGAFTTRAFTTGALSKGALTPREHEVVALLASGLSNRDIARKLFISPATAARHVANILAKLGFSSRSQVAAWASGGYRDPRSGGTD